MRTQQERTHKRYNLNLVDELTNDGMPVVRRTDKVPMNGICVAPQDSCTLLT